MLDPSDNYHGRDRPLGLDEVLAALVEDGLVTTAQSEQLRFQIAGSGQKVEHPLVPIAAQKWAAAGQPRTLLDLERLTRWLAGRSGVPYARIDPLKIDVAAVTGVVKHAYASRFRILPIAIDDDVVTIATSEPYVREWERELSELLKLRFRRVLVNPVALRRYLGELYSIGRTLAGAAADRSGAPISSVGNFEGLVDLKSVGEPDANDQHIVRLVDWLLQYAFEQRASDIHLEPRREAGDVRFRIDGVLHLVNQLPPPVLGAVTSRLKALGRMDVIERRRPQDGRIKTRSPAGQEVELRLSTMPTAFGEKLVMRIFDPDVLVKSFAELGLSADDEARWRAAVEQPHGMLVVTGPTGSGKTTTLYSLLKQLASPELNVCTIEDPIELVDPALNQMNVQPAIGIDFASGVRTLLRQDPDVIMVGEIRDSETASTAFQAALTGHLVLTTLHTNDAPSAISRFIDLGVAPYLIRSALIGVVAQRLVRTLCPHCRRPVASNPDEWRALVAPLSLPRPVRTFEAPGCDECRHTGFRGRIGIFEMLAFDDETRRLVTESPDLEAIRARAARSGMRSLRGSGAEKVAAGLTTAAEVLSVVQG